MKPYTCDLFFTVGMGPICCLSPGRKSQKLFCHIILSSCYDKKNVIQGRIGFVLECICCRKLVVNEVNIWETGLDNNYTFSPSDCKCLWSWYRLHLCKPMCNQQVPNKIIEFFFYYHSKRISIWLWDQLMNNNRTAVKKIKPPFASNSTLL